MTAGETLRVRVEGIASGGAALARAGGKSVFIEGAAAGELVLCRVVEDRRSWARAEALDIIEPSADRVRPLCGSYGICGGCNFQYLSYAAQLAAKTAILKDAFVRIGGFIPPEPAVVPSSPWEYRNRMRFHRIKAGNGRFGLQARNSHAGIPITDCPIADPGIRAMLREAAKGGQTLSPPPGQDRCTVYARQGLFLSEGGTRRGRTVLLDREIALDAAAFFQSNGAMLERLIVDLRETAAAADRSRPMADIYAGVGTFTAFLGRLFPRSDLVEENTAALALARENLNGIDAALFALRETDWLKQNRPRGRSYGFIVADPPRRGLSPSLAAWLAAEGPPLLAYVSCDPATLARDSGVLARGGYELADLHLYDFYPQTAHIESLAVFRKG